MCPQIEPAFFWLSFRKAQKKPRPVGGVLHHPGVLISRIGRFFNDEQKKAYGSVKT
jgi:hypothetical protein